MDHLVAHVVNAQSHDTAEVEWEVASLSTSGQWWTNDGREIWPFYTQCITEPVPAIPDGWIEHLHTIATHHATNHRAPTISLAEALGFHKPKPAALPPIVRRI